jgi:hypothetical protein
MKKHLGGNDMTREEIGDVVAPEVWKLRPSKRLQGFHLSISVA